MIVFNNVSKAFKYKGNKIIAADNVNLHIKSGEMVALTGSSGSGKTTVLNMIGGIYKQTSGEYLFKNQMIPDSEAERAKFRNENIGYILQNYELINNRNIMYNISLPLRYANMKKSEIKEKVFSVANFLGISDKLEMYPNMLSGGECQRVAIARAIIRKPKVILADEPTSSLDNENKKEVIKILQHLNAKGMTIVIATHDKEISEICNREILINKRKVHI